MQLFNPILEQKKHKTVMSLLIDIVHFLRMHARYIIRQEKTKNNVHYDQFVYEESKDFVKNEWEKLTKLFRYIYNGFDEEIGGFIHQVSSSMKDKTGVTI